LLGFFNKKIPKPPNFSLPYKKISKPFEKFLDTSLGYSIGFLKNKRVDLFPGYGPVLLLRIHFFRNIQTLSSPKTV